VTLHAGARYGYEQVARQHTLAPRVDAAVPPFEDGPTATKGGIGQFFAKPPPKGPHPDTQPARPLPAHAPGGQAAGITMLAPRTAGDGLQTPNTTSWNVEVDQLLATGLFARAGYRQTKGSDQLVVDPSAAQGTLWLSSRGTSKSREFEATIRK